MYPNVLFRRRRDKHVYIVLDTSYITMRRRDEMLNCAYSIIPLIMASLIDGESTMRMNNRTKRGGYLNNDVAIRINIFVCLFRGKSYFSTHVGSSIIVQQFTRVSLEKVIARTSRAWNLRGKAIACNILSISQRLNQTYSEMSELICGRLKS